MTIIFVKEFLEFIESGEACFFKVKFQVEKRKWDHSVLNITTESGGAQNIHHGEYNYTYCAHFRKISGSNACSHEIGTYLYP